MQKFIFCVSLESERKYRAAAMYDGTHLSVTHCDEILGTPGKWLQPLLDEIKEKSERGFVVMIEDRTGSFSPYGTPFCFDDFEGDRTVFQNALDWYFALDGSGNLILDKTIARHAIKRGSESDLLDAHHDDKGRVLYRVDWQKFGGGRKAVLMCVAGAMMEQPLSDRYLQAMIAASCTPHTKSQYDPLASWRAITVGATMTSEQEYEAAVREQARLALQRKMSYGD